MTTHRPKGFIEPGAQPVRRFWTTVELRPEPTGFGITLDGRPLRTPARNPLILPTEALAERVAEDWRTQGEIVRPDTMPATRLAQTAIDRVSQAMDEVADQIAAYAGSDALCYFAEAPRGLALRQEAAWGPWLSWAELTEGLVFIRTEGIAHRPQLPETVGRVRDQARALDPFRLTALATAVPLFGSAILGLALLKGAVSGDEAFDLSRLDEAWQEEQWGVDEEAAERTGRLRDEARLVDRWFRALD